MSALVSPSSMTSVLRLLHELRRPVASLTSMRSTLLRLLVLQQLLGVYDLKYL